MPTSIQDLIIPEVVGEIASALMVDRTALVNSGVASPDYNNVDIREGGEFCKVPFWNETQGEAERLVEGGVLTPDKITMGEDKLVTDTQFDVTRVGGPPLARIGRCVFYRRTAVLEWLESREQARGWQ